MNINEIEKLLDKFYAGETSLSEETALKEFFNREEVPEGLKQHRALFLYCQKEAGVTLHNPAFDGQLEKKLQEQPSVIPLSLKRRRLYYFSAAAASLLILLGLFLTLRNDFSRRQKAELVATPAGTEQAFAETRDALMMVSVRLNTGLDQMQRLDVLDHAMQQMKMFNKFYQYQNQIINPDAITHRTKKNKP